MPRQINGKSPDVSAANTCLASCPVRQRLAGGFWRASALCVVSFLSPAFIILCPFSATPRCEETRSSRPPAACKNGRVRWRRELLTHKASIQFRQKPALERQHSRWFSVCLWDNDATSRSLQKQKDSSSGLISSIQFK